MTSNIQLLIVETLQNLIGLPLSFAKSAVDMRCFNFGDVTVENDILTTAYALHIQCSWRVEKADRVITGRRDYYLRASDNEDPTWEPGLTWGNLQDQQLVSILGRYDRDHGAIFRTGNDLIVEDVVVDAFGGCALTLSGGYKLVLFPDGSESESWRLLPRGSRSHFVVEATEVEYQ